ncbi:MAG: 2'-O-glycosyltransferase CruG [Cyanobacteria bacterium J06638_20]
MTFGSSAIALLFIAIQIPALALLLARLLKGARRLPSLTPQPSTGDLVGQVSVVVPTLNEAERIQPCLDGLTRQSYEVREVIVVDSRSTDGTGARIKAQHQTDPRFRLMTDDPLPADWVGRPWALHNGYLASSARSRWILGIDADTQPQPSLVASLVQTAEARGYDLVSLAPQFILKGAAEWWLQPALLVTLLYRFGAAGADADNSERVMANGQCFLIRRSLLEKLDGYYCARQSFCDDVTLAREAARQGASVGFLDGAKLLQVRMYDGVADLWEGWGRSLDLKDAATVAQKWGDLAFLLAVQGLPFLALLGFGGLLAKGIQSPMLWLAFCVSGLLVAIRFAFLIAILSAYDRQNRQGFWAYWLSPLADPLAVLRIFLSSIRTPKQWRGRVYGQSMDTRTADTH